MPGDAGHLEQIDRAIERGLRRRGRGGLETDPSPSSASSASSGADLPSDDRAIARGLARRGWTDRHELRNDTFAVLRAGTDRDWGVGLVCGSGTNCTAVHPDGTIFRFPAMGTFSGDWGGGHELGEAAMWHAVRAEDGRGPATSLRTPCRPTSACGRPETCWRRSTSAASTRTGSWSSPRSCSPPPERATRCPARWSTGRPTRSCSMVGTALRRLRMTRLDPHVVLGGGVLRNEDPRFHARIEEGIAAVCSRASVRALSAPPLVGAAMLGLDLLGATPAAHARAHDSLTHDRLDVADSRPSEGALITVAGIALDHVSKVFGNGVLAVDDVSLQIVDGEFMVLVGPSGCGKSTILRMIAGLEEVTAGEIEIGEDQVTDLEPKRRDIAMVFQNYALYPHMSVEQNLAFGLKLRGTPKPERAQRVKDVATILGLDPLMERKPAELSGGQRQRVAIGRAMVREPRAFLMDEPLSNLDAKLRVQMRAELMRLHERLGTTTVYVTHDQVEAMTLGTRVTVLRDGVVQQVDTPQNLYNLPANLFVAAFIGSPPMNLVQADVRGDHLTFADWQLPIATGGALDAWQGRSVILGIRPADIEDHDVWRNDSLPTIEVKAEVTEELGSEVNILFRVDAPPVAVEEIKAAIDEAGEEDLLLLAEEDPRCTFCARVDARTVAKPGSPVRLSFDPSRFHYFDPDTGARDRVSRAPLGGRLPVARRGHGDHGDEQEHEVLHPVLLQRGLQVTHPLDLLGGGRPAARRDLTAQVHQAFDVAPDTEVPLEGRDRGRDGADREDEPEGRADPVPERGGIHEVPEPEDPAGRDRNRGQTRDDLRHLPLLDRGLEQRPGARTHLGGGGADEPHEQERRAHPQRAGHDVEGTEDEHERRGRDQREPPIRDERSGARYDARTRGASTGAVDQFAWIASTAPARVSSRARRLSAPASVSTVLDRLPLGATTRTDCDDRRQRLARASSMWTPALSR